MTTKTTASDKTKLTADELVDSLTGFEELAIEKAFDSEFFELSNIKRLRALAMIHHIREGKSQPDAKKTAYELTQTQLADLFADDENEDAEADAASEYPVTAAGKDADAPA